MDDVAALQQVFGTEVARRIRAGRQDTIDVLLDALTDPAEPPLLKRTLVEAFAWSVEDLSDPQAAELFHIAWQMMDDTSSPGFLRSAAAKCAAYAASVLRERRPTVPAGLDAFESLLLAYTDNQSLDEGIRRAAILGLQHLRSEELPPKLLEIVARSEGEPPDVVRCACVALGDMNEVQAIPMLSTLLLATEDESVFGSAAHSLGALGTEEGLAALVGAVDRFGGVSAVDIRRQSDTVLALLGQPESAYWPVALRAVRYLRPEDRDAGVSCTILALPHLRETDDVREALAVIGDVGTREQCGAAARSLGDDPRWHPEWSRVEGRGRAVTGVPIGAVAEEP
jgi:hypothetical protein